MTNPIPVPMDPSTVIQALGALVLVCTGILITQMRALAVKQTDHGEKLARIETTLTGQAGNNGVVGDIRQVRARQHRLMNDMHTVFGKLELDSMERRMGYDRREEEA